MQMTQKLRIGVVGCGGFSLHFVRFWLEVAEVVALCDVNEDNMASLAKEYGLRAPRYVDWRRLFDAGGMDAVVIMTGNDTHASIAIAAAEAGLHVFCEKAMARTVRECWQMVEICEQQRVKLMIGHKRRLRPPWKRMIELTDIDLLGEALAITVCQYCDRRSYAFFDRWWGSAEKVGGCLHLQGVHVVDWFRAMCGDAASVTANYGPQQDVRYQLPDLCHTTFQFKTGALASINSSLSYPLHQFREGQGPWGQCRNGGFKLVPHMENIDLYWQRLDDDRVTHERFDDLGVDVAFRREVGDFVRWITEDFQPCLTWVEGLRCVEMMEAAYHSAEAGGVPVTLPLYPDLERPVKKI